MTDIPKVITTLVDKRTNSVDGTNATRTYTKSPESDRPVFYNTNGFLETSLPNIRGAYFFINNTNSLSGAKRNTGFATALQGDYFSSTAAVTLDPCVVSPSVSHLINAASAAQDNTWTWPSITATANHLREKFPDLYRPGLCWDTYITNSPSLRTLALVFTNATAPQVRGLVGESGTPANGYTLPSRASCLVRTLISDTTPGAERIDYFILHG